MLIHIKSDRVNGWWQFWLDGVKGPGLRVGTLSRMGKFARSRSGETGKARLCARGLKRGGLGL